MRSGARVWAVPLLASLGLADAAYLAVTDLMGELPACAGYAGCAQVNSSPFASIFGVPIAFLGTALYGVVFAVALWRGRATGDDWGRSTFLLYGLLLSAALFMAYLTAIELFVLHAICYWCVALALISFLLLFLVGRDAWAFGTRGLAKAPAPLR